MKLRHLRHTCVRTCAAIALMAAFACERKNEAPHNQIKAQRELLVAMSTSDQLALAIEKRLVVQLWYRGAKRTVDPHVLGTDHQGHELLSAWQAYVENGAERDIGWRSFRVDEIEKVNVTLDPMLHTAPGYKPPGASFAKVRAMIPAVINP
jgi:predicted DNA-binding transcriptional regulator YafY